MTTKSTSVTPTTNQEAEGAFKLSGQSALSATSLPADTGLLNNNSRLTASQLGCELSQFTGTEQWYRHGLNKNLLYTDGVQFFAENGGDHGAYWLVDIIATEYWPLLKREDFLTVFITVKESSAQIEVTNGNGCTLKTRAIAYTDLQAGVWKFYLTDNVLLLPSEY